MTVRRASNADRWIDVSVPLRTGMVHWPGDPGIRIERVKELSRGDDCTLSAISMGAHSGTHMDAPSHFLRGARDLDSLSLRGHRRPGARPRDPEPGSDNARGAPAPPDPPGRAASLQDPQLRALLEERHVREGLRLHLRRRGPVPGRAEASRSSESTTFPSEASTATGARRTRSSSGPASGSWKASTSPARDRDPWTSSACRSASRRETARRRARSSASGRAARSERAGQGRKRAASIP